LADKIDAAGFRLIIEPRHLAYLVLQQGRLYDLRNDLPHWEQQYHAGLLAAYRSMVPALPAECRTILDIGSGLGGIDVLLSRHYDGQAFVNLVDGRDDPPAVRGYAETFNDMEVALDFQERNGVERIGFCTPSALFTPRPMDLIISQASWCFHYPPEYYLSWVKACCHPGTVLILDVRKDYIWWNKTLAEAFEPVADLHTEHKFIRRAYRPRAA
jgi:SAM-dependent methyltransferase